MASGDVLAVFDALSNEAPASNYATLDTRNAHPVLDFDQSTDESAVFRIYLPANYAGGGLTVTLSFAATGITSGNVIWDVAVERIGDDVQDLDGDGFAAVQSSAATAVSATDGQAVDVDVTFTDGAQMDSLAAGEWGRIKVTRDANNVSDTAAADAELIGVVIKET